jgi:hypothetical protein
MHQVWCTVATLRTAWELFSYLNSRKWRLRWILAKHLQSRQVYELYYYLFNFRNNYFSIITFLFFIIALIYLMIPYSPLFNYNRVTLWHSWLKHCATSRKDAGSIPDGAIGNFHLHNPSGRSVGLGSTHPLREMSTRNVSWGVKGGRYVRLTCLPPTGADYLEILGASSSWKPKGLPGL